MPPLLTDIVGLLGINLVVCGGCLRLLNAGRSHLIPLRPWTKWVAAVCFLGLWLPIGAAALPTLAYIRGVSADLSITLVALACVGLFRRLLDLPRLAVRERAAVFYAVAIAAVFLYPLALGWGNWDAYRPGWGSAGMWLALLALSVTCWILGLRLLPTLIALSLLAWTAGLLESGNLWDYLLDPWLAAGSVFYCIRIVVRKFLKPPVAITSAP